MKGATTMNYDEFDTLTLDKKLLFIFKQVDGLRTDYNKLNTRVSNLYDEVDGLKKEIR